MKIQGKTVCLKPARLADRQKIFQWLTQSDVTSSMTGPPRYPDHPPPSWDEFKRDYPDVFFEDRPDGRGRNYIILAGGNEIGTIGYDNLDRIRQRVDLDIWMRSEAYCGRGFGTDAIETLVNHLHRTLGIREFDIDPSARNPRAIRAYQKAGFVAQERNPPGKEADYYDTAAMKRTITNE
jgi:diamine N-acetyltransferase